MLSAALSIGGNLKIPTFKNHYLMGWSIMELKVKKGMVVKVDYEGKFENGEVFDSFVKIALMWLH